MVFLRGTALDSTDIQKQPERLYDGLPNLAELERRKEATLDVAVLSTPPVLHDGSGEEMSTTDHEAMQQRLGKGLPKVGTESQEGASSST